MFDYKTVFSKFTGSSQPAGVPAQRMMTFLEAVQTCLEKYFCFKGRASRSEYWWWFLAYGLPHILLFYCVHFAFSIPVESALFFFLYTGLYVVCGAGTIPFIAVSVRRLHDTGLSGWWLLFLYLPGILSYALLLPWLGLIGLGLNIYFQSRPSESRANKYGDVPCTASSQPDASGQRMMSFTESVETCLKKCCSFKGRASRAEYWWWALAYKMTLSLFMYCSLYCDESSLYSKNTSMIIFLMCMAVACVGLLPDLAVSVRRLHDTGRSGWWLLACYVPFFLAGLLMSVVNDTWGVAVSSFMIVYFLTRPSEKRANKYGDVPCQEASTDPLKKLA